MIVVITVSSLSLKPTDTVSLTVGIRTYRYTDAHLSARILTYYIMLYPAMYILRLNKNVVIRT